MNQRSRLVLGTAQLGMPYGIANKTGQPDLKTAEKIIAVAIENGIFEFDTAQAYGKSEEVLGIVLRRLGVCERIKVVTKLNPEFCCNDFPKLQQALVQSLTRLRVPRLHGLLLHKEDQLDLWDKGLGEKLIEFVRKGLVDYLGVSVYTPDRAAQALQTQGIDMVQLPSNILERRFEDAGIFTTARRRKKKVYVRSVFLQGLVLKDIKEIQDNMYFAVPVLEKLDILAGRLGLSLIELALGYVKHAYPEVQVIFGAEIPEQIQMNVLAWDKNILGELPELARNSFNGLGEKFLNPALWPRVN